MEGVRVMNIEFKPIIANGLKIAEEAFEIIREMALKNPNNDAKDIEDINSLTSQHKHGIKIIKHCESIK
jgi:phage terminase large subunit-like protein